MPPLKPVQVVSWQMRAASTRAAFQVALTPRLGPKVSEHAAPFWSDLHPLPADPVSLLDAEAAKEAHWDGIGHWGFVALSQSVGLCMLPVGPASPVSHLLEETSNLVPCWDTSVFRVLFPPKDTPCPCSVPHRYSSSPFYLSFIFPQPCLLAFLRWCLALRWLLLLIN